MTIPGTIARNRNLNSRRLDAEERPLERNSELHSARQTAALESAEPWASNESLSRREYFGSLVPGLGALLVRSLRGAETVKRRISGEE